MGSITKDQWEVALEAHQYLQLQNLLLHVPYLEFWTIRRISIALNSEYIMKEVLMQNDSLETARKGQLLSHPDVCLPTAITLQLWL